MFIYASMRFNISFLLECILCNMVREEFYDYRSHRQELVNACKSGQNKNQTEEDMKKLQALWNRGEELLKELTPEEQVIIHLN